MPMTGIRAEVRIDSPPDCVVAAASATTGSEATSVTWTGRANDDEQVTEEFLLQEWSGDEPPAIEEFDEDLQGVFQYDSKDTFRFHRKRDATCPCEFVETFESPIRDVYARKGSLIITFHVVSIETLQEILAGLNSEWSNVSVDRLVRSDDGREVESLVLVDRSTLTERQREVLKTAHEMGYFAHPKRANASDVADALDINATTFTEHLSAAQRKLFESIMKE